jgi:hypothetical protein
MVSEAQLPRGFRKVLKQRLLRGAKVRWAHGEVGGRGRQECRTYGARTFEDGDPALTCWLTYVAPPALVARRSEISGGGRNHYPGSGGGPGRGVIGVVGGFCRGHGGFVDGI